MFFIYGILTNILFLLSPIIFLFRILKKKEDINRFQEKYCIYSKKNFQKTIWFHAVSVGELMSIIPVVKKLEKNKKVKKIIITSSTTSSAKIFKELVVDVVTIIFFTFLFFSNLFITGIILINSPILTA